MKAIRVHQPGGPEVLKYEDVPTPAPGANDVMVKTSYCGINFIDIYYRQGLYKSPLPFTLGNEASGIVERVGDQVKDVRVGDRVAFTTTLGCYAENIVIPAARAIPLPKEISDESAAAAMLQGMTAHYLTHSAFSLRSGHTCLIHAAAGGVGALMIQMAKRLGARVIGTVGTEEKAQLAKSAGADDVILYTQQDFETEVKRLTENRGVEVVYDSVGKSTYEKSMNCLTPRGYLVLFGQSSGAVPPIDPLVLTAKGSIFVTRPSLGHYTVGRSELLSRASDVLNWIAKGDLKLRIHGTMALRDAAEAQKQLEARKTTGKLLLKP